MLSPISRPETLLPSTSDAIGQPPSNGHSHPPGPRVRDEFEHIQTEITGSFDKGHPARVAGIVEDVLALMKDAGLDPFPLPRNPRCPLAVDRVPLINAA